MINTFPKFNEITSSDLTDMYSVTDKYEPYSDFNFTSLYSYNTDGLNRISILDENLIIELQDYHTGKPFLSFLGNTHPEATIDILFEFSQKQGFGEKLRMVPETSIISVLNRNESKYKITEDIDNFDYIYDVEDLEKLEGNDHHVNRRQFLKFIECYPNCVSKVIDVSDEKIINQIFKLFNLWAYQSDKSVEETHIEKTAIERFLTLAKYIDLYAFGVFDEENLIDFSFYEKISGNYALGHFGKADKNYSGLYRFAQSKSCSHLRELGVKFLNLEQDLGIEGLRKTKKLWRPIKFLKKYTIEKADTI